MAIRLRILDIFNATILLTLLALNFYLYVHRNEGYAYKKLLNYKQLYALDDNLRIKDIQCLGDDSVIIQFNREYLDTEWRVSSDSGQSQYKATLPGIKLYEGKRIYKIETVNRKNFPTVNLHFNYTPSQVYQKNNRNRESVIELYKSSIPVGETGIFPPEHWQKYSPHSTTAELALAQQLILENTNVKNNDSTLVKVKKISAFIINTLDTHRGIPADSSNYLSPWQNYKLATANKSKVWCGDFCAILSFFLRAEGIVSREVCFEGKINSVYTAGHSFNEVYIPEIKKWVMVDLTSKAVFITNNFEYLNAVDFYELHRLNATGLMVQTVKSDTLLAVAYQQVKPFYDYYFDNEPQLMYYFRKHFDVNLYKVSSKLERYLFDHSTFASYAGYDNGDNKKFFVKQTAALALVSFVLYLFVVYLIRRMIKKQNPT